MLRTTWESSSLIRNDLYMGGYQWPMRDGGVGDGGVAGRVRVGTRLRLSRVQPALGPQGIQ